MGAEESLKAALRELAEADAAELLAEARAQARARVRQILADTLVESMLAGVRGELSSSAPAPRAPRAPQAPRGELGWYVYGVVSAEASPAWSASAIERAHAVEVVREGDVAAVTSRVAFEEFGEQRLREHLADMAWVEATARAHEEVLEQTRAQVTVIPMRMCTVYRAEEGVREMLRRESQSLSQALAALDGKTEMGLKAFADPARAQVVESSEVEGPGAGAAYMERRKRERDRAEEAAQRLEQAAAEVHDQLQTLAPETRLLLPQRPEASAHPGEMVLNAAYLVPDDVLGRFRDEVTALGAAFEAEGLELVLTGPWPAYNFVPDSIGATW